MAGAGTMGAGIALVAALAGFDVDLIEPDAAARERARERIAKDARRAGDEAAAARIGLLESARPDSRIVAAIEAVPEDLNLKRDVLAALAAVLPAPVLLATNTSSLSVSELTEGVQSPERLAGLHFFNPAVMMQLVEVVRGAQTSDETLAQARSLALRMKKTPVFVGDTPGFIVNRVARPFYLQAMHAYEAGVAPVDDLDRLARGAGFRMGPFELMDLIGLDVNLATSQSVYERTGAGRFEPSAIQRDLVAQNRLGRKTGAGFYDYAQGPPPHDDDLPEPRSGVNEDERIVIIGYAGLAIEMQGMLAPGYADVQLWENEDTLDEIPPDVTIVFDVGDGSADRTNVIAQLDALLPAETVIFVDAYATDVDALVKRLRHPERIAGYGILGALAQQRVVEIADADASADGTLELAQDLFESIGRRVTLVENAPGLFLGATVGAIVNEAVAVVEEGVAGADDVDLAMRLGANYPQGPIAWGREIGGDRVRRILNRVAAARGAAFAPHRALWVLDVQEDESEAAGDARTMQSWTGQ